ncbi:MAG: ferritin-like domain-containing protein [candidate division KSB1 bacterium]|nr:ferritin-like domain-containing protein [candidate division KSB1 bacterium]
MPVQLSNQQQVINELNKALGWELRAQALYAHYAAYLKGLEMLTLKGHFEEEAQESFGHAAKVRDIIATLGGEAVTTRDQAPIVHTEDYRKMLEEALITEQSAAAQYQKILPLVESHPPFAHTIIHILKDELDAVVEVEALLGR